MAPGTNGRLAADLLIWDLDGTLVNTLADIADSLNRVLAPLGHAPHSLDEVAIFIGSGIRQLIERALPDDPRIDDLVAAFREDYSRNLTAKSRLYPGVEEMLCHFASKPQVVISNKLQTMTRVIAQDLGIATHFREIIGQGGDYPIKPDPASTLAMIAAHGTTPERTVFIGDSDVDFQTARSAGTRSVLVTYGLRPRSEVLGLPADVHLDDIRGLAGVIC